MSSPEFIWILHPKLTLKRFGSFWIHNWCTEFWHASKKHAHFKVATKAVPHGWGCSGDNHQVQVLRLIPLRWFSLLPHKELVIGCHWCWMCWWHPVTSGDIRWAWHSCKVPCPSLQDFTGPLSAAKLGFRCYNSPGWASECGMNWDELGWGMKPHEATKTKAFVTSAYICDLLRPRPNMPESSSW